MPIQPSNSYAHAFFFIDYIDHKRISIVHTKTESSYHNRKFELNQNSEVLNMCFEIFKIISELVSVGETNVSMFIEHEKTYKILTDLTDFNPEVKLAIEVLCKAFDKLVELRIYHFKLPEPIQQDIAQIVSTIVVWNPRYDIRSNLSALVERACTETQSLDYSEVVGTNDTYITWQDILKVRVTAILPDIDVDVISVTDSLKEHDPIVNANQIEYIHSNNSSYSFSSDLLHNKKKVEEIYEDYARCLTDGLLIAKQTMAKIISLAKSGV